MSNTKTGRNDPCPCGSGKKFKHCCLGRAPNPASDVARELENLAADREFDSLEDFNAFADQFMQRRNQAPMDDFCGLSPDQMSELLYAPLDSPHLVRFPDVLPGAPRAPSMTLFNIIADADRRGRTEGHCQGQPAAPCLRCGGRRAQGRGCRRPYQPASQSAEPGG